MNDIEHQIQKAAVGQLRNVILPRYNDPPMWSTPNGGYRSKRTGKRLRDEGSLRGVPDVFIARRQCFATQTGDTLEHECCSGLFIEVKQPNGRLRDEQRALIPRLQKEGYAVIVCYSTQEIIDAVILYLEGYEKPHTEIKPKRERKK